MRPPTRERYPRGGWPSACSRRPASRRTDDPRLAVRVVVVCRPSSRGTVAASAGVRTERHRRLEHALVSELAAALGTEDTAAARVHDELAAGEALERRAAQQGGQLLVEGAGEGGDAA